MCEPFVCASSSGVPCRNNLSAGFARFGTEIDHPVRFGNQIKIVFDHDDRVAGIDETLNHFDQSLHVCHVQADGRFFEDEQIVLLLRIKKRGLLQTTQQMRDEFHALRFAAAERGAGLSEFQIAKAGVAQRLPAGV